MVHYGGVAVRIVEIWAGYTQARPTEMSEYLPSPLEVRLGRNHLLMQDTNDANSFWLQSVIDDVLPWLMPAKTGTDCVAPSTHLRILREGLETRLQALGISNCLVFAPSLKRISRDGSHIGLRGL